VRRRVSELHRFTGHEDLNRPVRTSAVAVSGLAASAKTPLERKSDMQMANWPVTNGTNGVNVASYRISDTYRLYKGFPEAIDSVAF